jgi:hypothetical protein
MAVILSGAKNLRPDPLQKHNEASRAVILSEAKNPLVAERMLWAKETSLAPSGFFAPLRMTFPILNARVEAQHPKALHMP